MFPEDPLLSHTSASPFQQKKNSKISTETLSLESQNPQSECCARGCEYSLPPPAKDLRSSAPLWSPRLHICSRALRRRQGLWEPLPAAHTLSALLGAPSCHLCHCCQLTQGLWRDYTVSTWGISGVISSAQGKLTLKGRKQRRDG